ncbi:MAG: rRNA maturation RNase YbeY [Patescibacteria group bacterium]|nr:rRNA maturation RNase YbeY [Patescibacteria group bacterium]MDE2144612.1 rRNA maturation RNase YbeY [Patescibacteria group bacterium]
MRVEKAKIFIGKVLRLLDVGRAEADVFFITSAEMRRLNRAYRGKDKTTNVLSFESPIEFPRPDLDKKTRHLGEIYINPSYIKKHGESQEEMLTHGLLHLLGFNHEEKNDRINMHNLEKKISSILGY